MDTLLRYIVIATFLFSIISLTVMVFKTFSFGKKELYAEPKGSVGKGIIYAFGRGMMPWEKESAGKHLPTYIGGVIYHGGVFLSLLYLLSVIVEFPIPAILLLPLRVFCAASIAAGLGLLVKRYAKLQMRELSCPDDGAANILVDLFLLITFLHTLLPGWNAYLFLISIIMFLYIPFGKIRHCFFFFYIRILFGLFYGRRNVFPPKSFEKV